MEDLLENYKKVKIFKKKIILSLLLVSLIIGSFFFVVKELAQRKKLTQTNQSIEIRAGEGNFTLSADGTRNELPKNFPKDVFVFPDAEILVSYMGDEENKIFSLNYITETSINDSLNKYKEELRKSGWEAGLEANLESDSGYLLSYKKTAEDRKIIFSIGKDTSRNSGKTYISLNGVKAEDINNNNPIQ